MTRPMPGPLAITLALSCAGAALLGVACEEKKKDAAPALDGGASPDKYATADPKLENALKAAASAAPTDENAPPLTGIFEPGLADKRHPKGVPTKVDTLGDGSEPRVDLGGGVPDTVRATSYGPAALELAMQMGPRAAMPTINLGLTLGPSGKDGPGPDWLVADVKKASPAQEQFGDLPAGTDKAIATLEGTQLRVKLDASGAESDLEVQLGKQAEHGLQRLVQNAAEALVMATVPLPSKPVGVGAQWIAETRMPLSGLDVIAYRAYRVKSIEGNRVHLSMDVKAYAAGPDTELQGLPQGATLEQIDAQAQGEMELVRGEIVARKSDLQQRVVLMFRAPGAAQQPDMPDMPGQPQPQPGMGTLTAQMQSQATFVRGEDLRAALHGAPRPSHP